MKREKEIRKLLGNDYHLSIEYNEFGKDKWSLFKKYNDFDVYFSKDNKVIMNSEENSEDELYEFAKKHHRKDYKLVGDKVINVSLLVVVIISIINIFVGGIFNQFILISDFWLILWMITNHYVFKNNWKVDMLEIKENFKKIQNKEK